MALKIIDPKHKNGKKTIYGVCEILVDSESEIKAFGEIVTDDRMSVEPAPGSVAYTADMSAVYILSPSGVWMKAGV